MCLNIDKATNRLLSLTYRGWILLVLILYTVASFWPSSRVRDWLRFRFYLRVKVRASSKSPYFAALM